MTESCTYGDTQCEVCAAGCQLGPGITSYCGDGLTDGNNGEVCDDGNTETEACDYGLTMCTVCDGQCQYSPGVTSYCGDGNVDPPIENCDDGNDVTETCKYGETQCSVCAMGCIWADGSTSYCGDYVVDGGNGETCDDGNTNDGDGCDSNCQIEGGACSGPNPGGDVYVDASLGVDDAGHGNGPGACAVQSIQYALTTTADTIIVAGGDYDAAASLINVPAGKVVKCDPNGGSNLNGQANKLSYAVVVELSGGEMYDCNIIGSDQNGYCVEVTGPSTLFGTYVTQCGGSAVRVVANGSTIDGNTIDHNATHIFYQNASSTGSASANNFMGTPADNVSCGANSAITGTGNIGTQGCDPDCNCPANFF